jgi:Skp family chaperone for outer membrane proteins
MRASLVLLLVCLFGFQAVAAEPVKAPVKIPVPITAVIDVQRILQETLAAKSVQQQLEMHRAKFQSEIAREEELLRKAEQDLTQSRSSLQPDAYAEREQLLRQRFLTVERHVQSRRKALDQAFTDSMNIVRKSLLEVVEKTAKERGVNLIIVKQQALWSDSALDVTDEVLGRLDKALPRVTVKVSSEDEKAPSP